MNFDASRLRRADQIVGVSAVLFFIFLFFFKWYGVSSNVPAFGGISTSYTKSGWSVFTNSRWIWLLTIIVALVAVARASGALSFESPVQLSVVVAALGALSTILILYRIVHHPTAGASIGTYHLSVGIKIGIWLGLIAAVGLTYGAYLAMQDEGTSLADVREQASGALSSIGSQGGSSAPPADSTAGGETASQPPTPPIPPAPSSQPPAPPVSPPPSEPPSPGATA